LVIPTSFQNASTRPNALIKAKNHWNSNIATFLILQAEAKPYGEGYLIVDRPELNDACVIDDHEW